MAIAWFWSDTSNWGETMEMKDKRMEKVKKWNEMDKCLTSWQSIHTRQTPGRLLFRTSKSRACYVNCTTNRAFAGPLSWATLMCHCGNTDYQGPWVKQILYPLIFNNNVAVPPKVKIFSAWRKRQIPIKSVQNAGLTNPGPKASWQNSSLVLTENPTTSYASHFVKHHSVVRSALHGESHF